MVLVYLPTKLAHQWGFYVGRYSSTMEQMGHGTTESESEKIIPGLATDPL